MFIKIWINIIFLLAAAWGCHEVIADKFYGSSQWQYYACLVSPWVLFFGSIKAWHRCFTWRRMSAAKNISPDLSRGRYQQSRKKDRMGILEYACSALFLIAVLAIMKQLRISHGVLWIALFLITLFMLHLLVRKVR